MWRRRQIYEGTPKVLFEGPEPGTLVQYFKDNAADHEKRGTIIGKGVLNSRICEFLMLTPAAIGIPTQCRRPLDMRERPVREVEIIPLRGVVHNVPAGSLASSVSAANSASFAATTPCASSSPTRSARTICGFGTAAPRKNSTRIASGRTGNNLLKATRRWRRLEILPEGGRAGFMGPRAIR